MDVLKERLRATKESIVELERQVSKRDEDIQKVIQEKKMLKSKINEDHRVMIELELKMENVEKELKFKLERLEESLLAAVESKKARDYLEKKCIAQENLMQELEIKAEHVRMTTNLSQEKFNEALQRLKEVEEKSDKLEILNENKEKVISELEGLCNMYTNKAKFLIASEASAKSAVDSMENEIKEFTEKLKSATSRAREAEVRAQASLLELANLEDELVEWKEKNASLQSEVDRLNCEVQEA